MQNRTLYIVIFILIVLLISNCDNTNKLEIDNAILQKENIALNQRKQAIKTIIKYKTDTIIKVKTKIVEVKQKTIDKVAEVDNYKLNDFSQFYKKRYDLNITVNDTFGKLNVKELISYDGLKEEVILKDIVIFESENIIKNQDTVIKFSDLEIANLNDINKNNSKLLKKEKRQSSILKIALIAVSGVLVWSVVNN